MIYLEIWLYQPSKFSYPVNLAVILSLFPVQLLSVYLRTSLLQNLLLIQVCQYLHLFSLQNSTDHCGGYIPDLYSTLFHLELKGQPVTQPLIADQPKELIGNHNSIQYNLEKPTHSIVFIPGSI